MKKLTKHEVLKKFQISDNGYVTFDAPLLSTLPKPFPIKSGSYVSQRSVMVAPYWSDIDTRCGGKVYYWQVDVTQGSGLFKKIQDDVALARLGALFNPTSAVIVTWKAVTPENTFPCRDKRVSQSGLKDKNVMNS